MLSCYHLLLISVCLKWELSVIPINHSFKYLSSFHHLYYNAVCLFSSFKIFIITWWISSSSSWQFARSFDNIYISKNINLIHFTDKAVINQVVIELPPNESNDNTGEIKWCRNDFIAIYITWHKALHTRIIKQA